MSISASPRSITSNRLIRFFALLPKQDWLVVGWVLAIKLLLLLFGVESYQILENKRPEGTHAWLAIWNRWDALHYHQLAEVGYKAVGTFKAWFYPLFPWCVRLIAHLNGNYLISAFIVSGVASIAAAIFLRRLVE